MRVFIIWLKEWTKGIGRNTKKTTQLVDEVVFGGLFMKVTALLKGTKSVPHLFEWKLWEMVLRNFSWLPFSCHCLDVINDFLSHGVMV
jgi:hypothetical protein